MVTQADWIKVELTEADAAHARRRAELQQGYAQRRGFRVKGFGSVETATLGALGELAVARYESTVIDPDWTWEADVRRGFDVAGWQVRCRSKIHYGLNLHRGDHGRFLLAFGHEAPTIWLAGWLDAADGFRIGEPRLNGKGDRRWWCVDQIHLQPLPEQNGYTRRGEIRRLVDPQTPFWDEVCGAKHPIIEHRMCRAT